MNKVILKAPNGNTVSVPVGEAKRWIEQGYKQLSSADVRIVKQGEQKS